MSAAADFIAAMEAAGIVPAEPIADQLGDGKLVRFRVDGDRAGRRNGWAVLHEDGRPAGAFGSYKLGVRETWRSGAWTPPAEYDRLAHIRRCEAERARRNAETAAAHADAAERAERLWLAAGEPTSAHPYLAAKRLHGEGLRQRGDTLLAPMRDIGGKLWNVQRIVPDGSKLFLKGGRQAGLFWSCGALGDAMCIGEGVGTMAVVRRATGRAVVAAFSTGNLDAVARTIHGRWPRAELTICADDDAHLVDHPQVRRNLGMDVATAVAGAIGARLAIPTRS